MIKGTDLIPSLRTAASGRFENMSAAGGWVLEVTGGPHTPFATFIKAASVRSTAAAISLRGVKEKAWKDLLAGVKAKNASKVKSAAAILGGAVGTTAYWTVWTSPSSCPPKRAKTPPVKPKPKRAKTARGKAPAKKRKAPVKRKTAAPPSPKKPKAKAKAPRRRAAAAAPRAAATAAAEKAVIEAARIAAKGTATRGKTKVRFDIELTPVK